MTEVFKLQSKFTFVIKEGNDKQTKSGTIVFASSTVIEVLFEDNTRGYFDPPDVYKKGKGYICTEVFDTPVEDKPEPIKKVVAQPKATKESVEKPYDEDSLVDKVENIDDLTAGDQNTILEEDDDISLSEFSDVEKLTKNLKTRASHLHPSEARHLVAIYYTIQKYRIRTNNQVTQAEKNGEPYTIAPHFLDQFTSIEKQLKLALDKFSMGTYIGEWMRSIVGIGPVIAAGYLAHVDITKCQTAGALWRFSGSDPTSIWLSREKAAKLINDTVEHKGPLQFKDIIKACNELNLKPHNIWHSVTDGEELEKISRVALAKRLALRPWNASLKRIGWILGNSFVKNASHANDVYGKFYHIRKEYENEKNANLDYADQAERILTEKNFGDDTKAIEFYKKGMLPPGHIHSRSMRYAVHLFLSHLHAEWYEWHFKKPAPKPFAIDILNHSHEIKRPRLR